RLHHDATEEAVADHRQHDEVQEIDHPPQAVGDRGAEDAIEAEPVPHAVHHDLDGADGDEQEAPEDEQVVPALLARLDLALGDLFLADEVDEDHRQAGPDLVQTGAWIFAAHRRDTYVTEDRPGEETQRDQHHRREDELSDHGVWMYRVIAFLV